jgi:hypothetical protein
MRKYLALGMVYGVLFGAANVACSADGDDSKAIVDKAIKAAGGEAKLADVKALTATLKGKASEGGKVTDFTMEASVQGMSQFRLDAELSRNGMQLKMALVFNGDKAMQSRMGTEEVVPEALVKVFGDVLYGFRLVNTPTELKNPALTLAPLGEIMVDGKPAVGVRVTKANKPDVNIYFNKATGYPVKAEMKFTNTAGQEQPLEFEFKDYQDISGVRHFSNVTMKVGDLLILECALSDIKLLQKLDASVFEKP